MVKREREQLLPSDAELPFVSILAPAYCQAACVKDAMSALVRLDYPAYEVIVVDDGSTDDTYQVTLASRFTWQASAFVQFQFKALNDVVNDKFGNY